MRIAIDPARKPLTGQVRVPSDKSISHRAVLFAALASGTSEIADVLDAADVRSTVAAVQALGASVTVSPAEHGLRLTVQGWGASGPAQPAWPVDCGNSGTTARLLAGALAGYPVCVTLVGDESLSRRPMHRVADPLTRMGARFDLAERGTLPMTIHGGPLAAAEHELPVASAQVKSALLLAGLRASGQTVVREPAPSRDHTERMLPAFGVDLRRDDPCTVSVTGPQELHATSLAVPADPSSAAFLAVAACLIPGCVVVLKDVCLNATRTGFISTLRRMGADITTAAVRVVGGEEVGDLRITGGATLAATEVLPPEVPALIDEVPVLAVAATAAHGTTRFRSVGELRVKESDRFSAIVHGLASLGARIREEGDDLVVEGPVRLKGGTVSSLGDHRLAMAYAVAGLVSSDGVEVDGFEAVDVSYPRFLEDLCMLAGC
ncbi:MAG: 3-phosphoshikimate 1-carboxyvinyltransferase [Coriobacteriia bacterium]|nr:3-phosphoshikimate 1-carboxyvinyltransferase [Coriobacteriia bacterium]